MDSQTFKAGDTDYQAIILPFQCRWHESVTNGKVKAVFRKKGPAAKANPKWMYAYFGAPVSAICAKLEVSKVSHLAIGKVVRFCDKAMLSEPQLRKYAGDAEHLCVFELGQCFVPKEQLGMDELSRRFGFQPTPSFIALSQEGWDQLDRALGFVGDK